MPLASSGPYPREIADELVLVLAAEGISAGLEAAPHGGLVIVIDDAEARRAEGILADEYPAGVRHAFAVRAAEQAAARARAAYDPDADRWFGPGSWVLFLLTAICTGVYLAEERAGGSEVTAVLLRFGASRPAHVRAGEWWRLATALFVHIGPRHLLGNMAALLVLGALGGQRLRFAASARYRGWQVIAALLAYLAVAVGAEPGVDTMAHLGGLVAGLVLGLVVPPPTRRAPGATTIPPS